MFIASQSVDYQKLKVLEPFLPFSVTSSSQQEYSVTPDIQESGISSPIMRINGDERDKELWNSLPPIFKTETFIDVKPESEILSSIRIGSSPVPEPLIMTRTFAGNRSLAVLGYGIYRWKLLGMAPDIARGSSESPDILSSFIDQSIQWIGASEKEKLVKIRSSRKFYIGGEKVEMISQVYNASLDPVDDAIVSVNISGPGTKREIRLANMGAGRYSASISGLPAGDYFYQGSIQQLVYAEVNIFALLFLFWGANLRHSHVKLGYFNTLEKFIMSPFQHQIHHSDDPAHFDKNFGAKLSLWDRLFGTLARSNEIKHLRFGLGAKESEKYTHFMRTLTLPFTAIFQSLRPNKQHKYRDRSSELNN